MIRLGTRGGQPIPHAGNRQGIQEKKSQGAAGKTANSLRRIRKSPRGFARTVGACRERIDQSPDFLRSVGLNMSAWPQPTLACHSFKKY